MKTKDVFDNLRRKMSTRKQLIEYYRVFQSYSFCNCQCKYYEQYRGSIIRLYHTIEKGLSYKDYRPGFGKENIEKLLISMEQYAQKYDVTAFFYETALDCLYKYTQKNEEYGYEDRELKRRIENLPGKPNQMGGVVQIYVPKQNDRYSFEDVLINRRSIRQFSDKEVDLDLLVEAVKLAQHTPSACNRQSWKTRIIIEKRKIDEILNNQNGNRGFGNCIDKLLVISADLRAQQRSRELFQAYIDGGMYAKCVLDCLYFKGIGSIPLSAALSPEQEKNVRHIIGMHEAEVLILFVGVGCYPEEAFETTRSEREPVHIEVL